MPLRYEDLPASLRQKADAKPKRSRKQLPGSSRGACHSCDWTGTYSQWERTHCGTGHARFDLELA